MYTPNRVKLEYIGTLVTPRIVSVKQHFYNKEEGTEIGFERVNSSISRLLVKVKVEPTYRSNIHTFVVVTLSTGESFETQPFISISNPNLNPNLRIQSVLQLTKRQNPTEDVGMVIINFTPTEDLFEGYLTDF